MAKPPMLNVELIIEGQKIINLLTLTKDLRNWLIVDSIAAGDTKDSSLVEKLLPQIILKGSCLL